MLSLKITKRGKPNADWFAQEMKKISSYADDDTEKAHGDADELMCTILKSLGYEKGVEIFEKMPKWYS